MNLIIYFVRIMLQSIYYFRNIIHLKNINNSFSINILDNFYTFLSDSDFLFYNK